MLKWAATTTYRRRFYLSLFWRLQIDSLPQPSRLTLAVSAIVVGVKLSLKRSLNSTPSWLLSLTQKVWRRRMSAIQAHSTSSSMSTTSVTRQITEIAFNLTTPPITSRSLNLNRISWSNPRHWPLLLKTVPASMTFKLLTKKLTMLTKKSKRVSKSRW